MNEVVYSNDSYAITPNGGPISVDGIDFDSSYAMINNKTGITEFRTPCLPEILRLAVHWDLALTNENHLWPYTRQDKEGPETGPETLLQ